MSYAPSLNHRSVLLVNGSSASKKARGIVQVLTKNVRPARADETLEGVRPVVETMVRGEEFITGSKMLAYANVGHAIGKSPSWVRKLIGRHEVGLQHFEWLNIIAAYGAICHNVERAAALERAKAAQLRSLVDAPAEGAAGALAGAQGADRGSEAACESRTPSARRSVEETRAAGLRGP